jgi:branched-chain amino acid transport system ATP-binding protein
VLDQGRGAHEGTGDELLDDPRVVELYLGRLVGGSDGSSGSGRSTDPDR